MVPGSAIATLLGTGKCACDWASHPCVRRSKKKESGRPARCSRRPSVLVRRGECKSYAPVKRSETGKSVALKLYMWPPIFTVRNEVAAR